MDIRPGVNLDLQTSLVDRGEVGAAKPKIEDQGEKFGDVWKKLQNQYGGQAAKPRQIKKALDKDDFLKLMVVQMKNQDPTKPFEAEQMATQMAQYASVEQLQNVNQNLTKLSTANQPMERLAMASMIGKVVTIDKERFPHQEGQVDPLSFQLPQDADSVKVLVVNESGETVFEKEMGSQKSGQVSLNWDGKDTKNQNAKAGTYSLRVQALDEKGVSIHTNPQSQGRVVGVSFEGKEPVFMVGEGPNPDKVPLKNIIKVDTDGAASPAGIAGKLGSAQNSLLSSLARQPSLNPSKTEIRDEQMDRAMRPNMAPISAQSSIPAPVVAEPPIKQHLAQAISDDGEKGFPSGLSGEPLPAKQSVNGNLSGSLLNKQTKEEVKKGGEKTI